MDDGWQFGSPMVTCQTYRYDVRSPELHEPVEVRVPIDDSYNAILGTRDSLCDLSSPEREKISACRIPIHTFTRNSRRHIADLLISGVQFTAILRRIEWDGTNPCIGVRPI